MIETASIPDMHRPGGDPNSAGAIAVVETIAAAGTYPRKAAFAADVVELLDAHREWRRTCFAQTEQEFRPIQHLRLNGALVFGQGAVATRTNRLVRETVLEFLASGWVPDGLTRCDDGRYRLQSAPTAATARPTLLLKRPW